MDLGAFRSLNIFTWRPSLSDTQSATRPANEQTPDTNTRTATSGELSMRGMSLIAVMFAAPLLFA
jgi:hypothetical protein